MRVLKDRLICGFKSKNKTDGKPRYYSKHALESVIPTVEGFNVYINHAHDVPKGRRKFEDLIGRVVNCKMSDKGLRGDLELSEYHPESQKIEQNFKDQLPLGGLSADWDIRYGEINGNSVVMEIKNINSIDYVAEAATTNILESDETPLTPIEEQMVKEEYVTVSQYQELLNRVNVMESKVAAPVVTNSPAYAPVTPVLPPLVQNQNLSVADLIRQVRG